ncbi:MAG: nucleotidyltransferase domain-containing protein [Candidatus Shapirobacteria bacterium]|jgi:DNA polymerase (family 10)
MIHHPSNSEVSEYLTNIAIAYEIKNKSRFRIVAYENAADTVLTYPGSLFELWQKDPKNLDSVPNIGPGIFKKIDYLFRFGKPYPKLKEAFQDIHPAVFTFTKINGIGPLIAHKLTQTLKFSKDSTKALDQLVAYCQKSKIKNIPSFGEKSEQSILSNTLSFLGRQNRMPFKVAQKLATKVVSYLHSRFPDTEFIPLGSLRRQSTTVGDIDIACASNKSTEIIDYFLQYPEIVQVIAQGKNKASLRLLNDIHVDLMVKPKDSFGALLQHFTGSRQHNILLRRHALKMGYSLSEYGIKDLKTGKINKFTDEAKFYNFLGLKLIPPSERTGESELEKYKMLSQDKNSIGEANPRRDIT